MVDLRHPVSVVSRSDGSSEFFCLIRDVYSSACFDHIIFYFDHMLAYCYIADCDFFCLKAFLFIIMMIIICNNNENAIHLEIDKHADTPQV